MLLIRDPEGRDNTRAADLKPSQDAILLSHAMKLTVQTEYLEIFAKYRLMGI